MRQMRQAPARAWEQHLRVLRREGQRRRARLEARRDSEEVEVSVIERGAGIPAARLPHLFRRHAGVGAGEAAGERAEDSGSGLGLVICRGLVEAHGGRIRAESAGPGRGTRIVFTLPAAEEAVSDRLYGAIRCSP